jgi:hypothetical protein
VKLREIIGVSFWHTCATGQMKSGANSTDEGGTGIKGSAEGKGATDKSTEIQQNRWARRAACLPATHRVVLVSNRALKARVQRTKLKSGVLLRFRGRRARALAFVCLVISSWAFTGGSLWERLPVYKRTAIWNEPRVFGPSGP